MVVSSRLKSRPITFARPKSTTFDTSKKPKKSGIESAGSDLKNESENRLIPKSGRERKSNEWRKRKRKKCGGVWERREALK
jgi:hypothetical protein